MRLLNTFGCCCVLPVIVLLAGIVHISPEASAQFQRLRYDGRQDVQQFGQYVWEKCGLSQ